MRTTARRRTPGWAASPIFEVDESTLRRSDAAAHILRLSVGRVARGMDVDIQRELRERMHLLEPEMTEGYVGRRILGNDVEIAFISAWEREPDGRSLDAPMWPDISASYDAFEVATFRPLVQRGRRALTIALAGLRGGAGTPPGRRGSPA